MDLSQRDKQTVDYTRYSALLEGDTLVLVKYLNDQPAYDPSGFQLSDIHRVHSQNLLATGSKVFKEKLESEWLNYRAAKKARVFPTLPEGIKYVIDLTPPEEGEDALELTQNLSCSAGVLNWHTAESRLGVSRHLVAGKDESTTRPEPFSQPTSPTKAPKREMCAVREPAVSELSAAVTSIINDETRGANYRGFIPDQGFSNLHQQPGRNATSTGVDININGKPAGSMDNGERAPVTDLGVDEGDIVVDVAEHEDKVLDYCGVRHRAGIERLLQVIEGKNPRLDSAPKMWTLASLAQYFDCPHVAIDYITTWVVNEPNCRFMEILPEATLKLGLKLQSYALARSGFSILVSEEALRIGYGKNFHTVPIKHNYKNLSKRDVARFGRIREHLDEDILNIIQHAGQNFHSRIEKVLSELIDKDMRWLDTLPQFAKLLGLEERLKLIKMEGTDDIIQPASLLFKTGTAKLSRLIYLLRHFVRGKIVFCLIDNLSVQQAKDGNAHRDAERWLAQESDDSGSFVHDFVYNRLSDHERMLTRGFWEMVREIEWNSNGDTNQIRDQLPKHNVYHGINSQIADSYGIEYVNMAMLEHYTKDTNYFIAKAIREGVLPTSVQISPGASNPTNPTQPSMDNLTDMLAGLKSEAETLDDTVTPWYLREPDVQEAMEAQKADDPLSVKSLWNFSMIDAMRGDAHESPLRFSLPSFLAQIQPYVKTICFGMLNKGENEFSIFCPTLVRLTDEEYKFLPLWAGGMDDGSGGVFEQEIPPAMKGPIGPGPSFHTGSTANSLAASELDFDDCKSSIFGSHTMEGIQTSLGVEDGFTDHLDRRIVYSEADFPLSDGATDHGALPDYAARATEQAVADDTEVVRGRAYIQEIREPNVNTSQIDSDDFFNIEGDEDGYDFDMNSDSEGTLMDGE